MAHQICTQRSLKAKHCSRMLGNSKEQKSQRAGAQVDFYSSGETDGSQAEASVSDGVHRTEAEGDEEGLCETSAET